MTFGIDPAIGALSLVDSHSVVAYTIAIDPFGRYLWGTSNGDTIVGLGLDPKTGIPIPLPGSPYSLNGSPLSVPTGPAVDPTGQYVYAGDVVNAKVYGFRIRRDGSLTLLGPVATLPFLAEAMVTVYLP